MLRLPYGVKDIFVEWLRRAYPDRAEKVIHGIEAMRGGKLNATGFGERMTGSGIRAELVERMFALHCERLGLNQPQRPLSLEHFRRPGNQQLDLLGALEPAVQNGEPSGGPVSSRIKATVKPSKAESAQSFKEMVGVGDESDRVPV